MGRGFDQGNVAEVHLVRPPRTASFYPNSSNRNDAKSVAIMAMACLHPVVKVQSASMHFFLDLDQDDDKMEASDDEATLLFYLRILSSLNGSTIGSRSKVVATPS